MGMSSPRPSLVDVARAPKVLRRQHRGMQRPVYTREDRIASIMASTHSLPADSTAPRLPSSRPIDHRWDQSRGIIFANAQRNVLRDFRWTPHDGIAFGDATASNKHTGWGQSCAMSSTARARAPSDNPQAMRPRNAVVDTGGRREAYEKLQKENKDLLKLDEERQRKLDDLRLEVDRAKNESRDKVNAMDSARRQEEMQQRREMDALRKRERELEKQRSALQTREDNYKDTVGKFKHETEAAAKEDAEAALDFAVQQAKSAKRDAEAHMNHARQREKDADATVRQLRNEQRAEAEERVQFNAAMTRQYEEYELPAIQRSETDRRDYSSYLAIWDQLRDNNGQLSGEYSGLIGAFSYKAKRWAESKDIYNGIKFSAPYTELGRRLRALHQPQSNTTEEDIRGLTSLRTQLDYLRADIKKSAHYHRSSMRATRAIAIASIYDTMSANQIASVDVVRRLKIQCNREIVELKSQLERSTLPSERITILRALESRKNEFSTLGKGLDLCFAIHHVSNLQALHQDSTLAKRIYFTVDSFRDKLEQASNIWDESRKQNAESLHSEQPWERMARRSAEDMARKSFEEIEEIVIFLRKQSILRDRLGKAEEDREELDARIDERYAKAKDAMFEAFAGIARSRSFLRTAPTIRTLRLMEQASEGKSPAFRRPASSTMEEQRASSPESRSPIADHGKDLISLRRRLRRQIPRYLISSSEEAKSAAAHEYKEVRMEYHSLKLRQAEAERERMTQESPDNWKGLNDLDATISKLGLILESVLRSNASDIIKAELLDRSVLRPGNDKGSSAFRGPALGVRSEQTTAGPESQSPSAGHSKHRRPSSVRSRRLSARRSGAHPDVELQLSVEQRLNELKGRIAKPDEYPHEDARLADIREYNELRIQFLSDKLPRLEKSRTKMEGTSAVDTDKIRNIDIEIRRVRRALDKFKNETSEGVPGSSSTLIDQNLQARIRALQSSSADQIRIDVSHSSGTSQEATTTASNVKSYVPFGSGMNLKASSSHQAGHPFWPTNVQYLHLDSPETLTFSQQSSISYPVLSQAYDECSLRSSSHVDTSTSPLHLKPDNLPELNSLAPSTIPLSSNHSTSPRTSQTSMYASSAFQPSQSSEVSTGDIPESQEVNDTSETTTASSKPDPETELTFQISANDFRNAAIASKNSSAAYWSHLLYKNSDGKTPKVLYCTNFDQAEQRAKEFLNEQVLGFDIEWEIGAVPGKSKTKNNVSLIQIASEDKIGLFHMALFKGDSVSELMPPSLRSILESGEIAKAGVNVQGDARRLKLCLEVEMSGLFELSHLYRVVMFSETDPASVNRKLFRLADQVQNVLRLPLKKDEVRTSAWSRRLVNEQTNYAASDAYAGFRLYHALEVKRKKMQPMPPRPAFWEEHLPLQLGDGTIIQPSTKRKREAVDGLDAGKVASVDDNEDEEFFDALESLETYELDSSQDLSQEAAASAPLSGIFKVEYPSLPSAEAEQEEECLTTELAADPPNRAEASDPTDAIASAKPATRGHPPPSPEIHAADAWVTKWRASLPTEYKLTATPSTLRAYHLWHEQRLSTSQVAALLREPPLSASTVASYILGALNKEDILPFDSERVRTEMLAHLPKPVAKTRYWRVMERIGQPSRR